MNRLRLRAVLFDNRKINFTSNLQHILECLNSFSFPNLFKFLKIRNSDNFLRRRIDSNRFKLYSDSKYYKKKACFCILSAVL